VHAVFVVVLASCTSHAACEASPSDPECPDLKFNGHYYDEWHRVHPAPPLQEIGDAVYPACNSSENCGPDPGGLAATDVWLLEGVDRAKAVIGIREDTDTYVIFVRRGVDPDTVPGLRRAAQPTRSITSGEGVYAASALMS
jgi:hypothetical protein